MTRLVLLPGLAGDAVMWSGPMNLLHEFHPQVADVHMRCGTIPDMAAALLAETAQLIRQNLAVISRPDARVHLPRLQCPVLVMHGDSDQLVPLDCGKEIAALAPQAEFVMVPRCGHMLTMEQPTLVGESLRRWFSAARGS